MTIPVTLVWLIVAALIIASKPLRARADCWWLALLWPCALAGVAGILFYEIALYKPFIQPILLARRRRSEMVP